MALVQCPECKTEVSTEAAKCPKCGFTLRKLVRSTFGKVVKWTFIGFNVLMLVWLVGGVGSASQAVNQAHSQAERAGAAIGTGIGAMLIIFLWVAGAVVLGIMTLLTRPKA